MAISKPHNVNVFFAVDDVEKTANFWKQAFGAKVPELLRGPDGTAVHGMAQFGTSYVMFGPASMRPPDMDAALWRRRMAKPRYNATNLYINVKNVGNVHRKAKAYGAEIEQGLTDQFWGDKTFVTNDNNGIVITFAEHVRNVTVKQMEKAMREMAP